MNILYNTSFKEKVFKSIYVNETKLKIHHVRQYGIVVDNHDIPLIQIENFFLFSVLIMTTKRYIPIISPFFLSTMDSSFCHHYENEFRNCKKMSISEIISKFQELLRYPLVHANN